MKPNFIDRLVGVFSPEAEFKRMLARGKKQYLERSYDAAQTFATDDWSSSTSGSANSEISTAQSTLRNKGRDAIRNNPYAVRGLNAIVSNTVGSGIMANIKGKNKTQTKKLNEAWKAWAETTKCDANRMQNFYGMQAQALRSTVESGEVVVLKEIQEDGFKLRLLESDHIVDKVDGTSSETNDVVQGVKIDKYSTPKAYFIYEKHPGDRNGSTKYNEYKVDEICHVYRQDRPGQLRGVSWFHPVIRQLEDFNQFQQATLTSRKTSACYMAFITVNDTDSTLSNDDLQTKREAENMLAPGSVRYLSPGEHVELATPPALTGYDEYCRQTLRAIASGLNVTYEALTSDYSQVNFSSGRMGHIEFRRNVEMWRWNMLIPQFCEPAFQHFLKEFAITSRTDVSGVTVEWVPEAWALIDPDKEISATIKRLRNGLTSRPKAVYELGYDPEQLDQEIAESNQKLDELEIILDSDPRKTTQAGLFQVTQSQQSQGNQNNVQDNKKESTDGSDSNSD